MRCYKTTAMILILAICGSALIHRYAYKINDDPTDIWKWYGPMDATKIRNARQILDYCKQNLQPVVDFRHLFPRYKITIFPSNPQKPYSLVHCETIAYGRYCVSMEQRIHTNKEIFSVSPIDSPMFRVAEITLGYTKNNGWIVGYGNSYNLTGLDWETLCHTNGDLSAIISNIVKDHPLDLSENYISDQIEDRNNMPDK